MLTQPTPRELQALARIAMSPEGMDILGLLQKEQQRLIEILMKSSGENLVRAQGNVTAIKEFHDLLKGSPELVKKSRPSQGV